MIREFTLKDVRCFNGEQKIKIRPLTFLIGENSTGKSTILGCFHVLIKALTFGRRHSNEGLDFNEKPYNMGTYVDIVRKNEPKLEEFSLEFTVGEDNKMIRQLVTFEESKEGTEPIIKEIKTEYEGIGTITTQVEKSIKGRRVKNIESITIQTKKKEIVLKENLHGWMRLEDFLDPRYLHIRQMNYFNLPIKNLIKEEEKSEYKEFKKFIEEVDNNFKFNRFTRINDIYSFAPVRSAPKRTYNPTKPIHDPEGGSIYTLLNNIYREEDRWKKVKKEIKTFGKQSKMFDDIDIKTFGNKSDPFQIKAKVRGQESNLMDVGYGVSQILPILVTIFSEHADYFAIQQPEVHLHPRSQAELCSYLVDVIKREKKNFIIETHSDYMIDRARIDVMKGKIAPEDVSIVYLEPNREEVKVHNISLDKNGNLENVPQGYRDFFYKEKDELLGMF